MKKVLLTVVGIALASFAFAGKNGVTELQKQKEALIGKGIISNGFYVNLGLAFPSINFNVSSGTVNTNSVDQNTGSTYSSSSSVSSGSGSQGLGTQFNIEIGNQWYFWKNDKMGVGLRVSWFQFGFSQSTLNSNFGNSSLNPSFIDLRFIKIAPQFTLGLGSKMALDFSFEIAPTILIGAAAKDKDLFAYGASGLLFSPGVKFRYNVFAAGFDMGFGSFTSTTGSTIFSSNSGITTETVSAFKGTSSIFFPRFYLGFKF